MNAGDHRPPRRAAALGCTPAALGHRRWPASRPQVLGGERRRRAPAADGSLVNAFARAGRWHGVHSRPPQASGDQGDAGSCDPNWGQSVSPPLRVSRVGSGVPGPFAGRAPSRGPRRAWSTSSLATARPLVSFAGRRPRHCKGSRPVPARRRPRPGACYACCWPRSTRTPFARSLTGADYTTGARVDGVTDGDE